MTEIARAAIRNADGEIVGYSIAHDDGRIERPDYMPRLPPGVYHFDPIEIPDCPKCGLGHPHAQDCEIGRALRCRRGSMAEQRKVLWFGAHARVEAEDGIGWTKLSELSKTARCAQSARGREGVIVPTHTSVRSKTAWSYCGIVFVIWASSWVLVMSAFQQSLLAGILAAVIVLLVGILLAVIMAAICGIGASPREVRSASKTSTQLPEVDDLV